MNPLHRKFLNSRRPTPFSFLTRSVEWDFSRKETFPVSQNTVLTSMLTEKQDINRLGVLFHNSKRNKAQFACLYLGFQVPKFAVLLFATGKIICIGAKTPSVSVYGLWIARNFIQSGAPFDVPGINNTVFTVTCDYRLDIVKMNLDNKHVTNFNPVGFIGCYYAPNVSRDSKKQPVCSNIFHTGRFTILSTKKLADALSFASNALDFLVPYRKPLDYGPPIDPQNGKSMPVRKWLREELKLQRQKRGLEGENVESNSKRVKVQEENVDFVNQLSTLAGKDVTSLISMLNEDDGDY